MAAWGCDSEKTAGRVPDGGGVVDGAALDAPMADAAATADVAADAPEPPADAGMDAQAEVAPALPTCSTAAEATKTAILRVTADDYVRIWFNGVLVAEPASLWSVLKQYDVQVFLNGGRPNVIAVEARNEWKQNGLDRGFIAELAYTVGDVTQYVNTDPSWKVATQEVSGWTDLAFDDGTWATPVSIGRSGIAPWGPVVFNTEAEWLWSYLPDQPADLKVAKETLWFRKVFFMNDQGRATSAQPCR